MVWSTLINAHNHISHAPIISIIPGNIQHTTQSHTSNTTVLIPFTISYFRCPRTSYKGNAIFLFSVNFSNASALLHITEYLVANYWYYSLWLFHTLLIYLPVINSWPAQYFLHRNKNILIPNKSMVHNN